MKIIEIIWDHRQSEGFAFDISFAGLRFERHRDIEISSKFVADITATVRRFGGYRYINSRQAFQATFPFEGSMDDRAAALIGQLEREGWTVRHVGILPASLSSPLKIAA